MDRQINNTDKALLMRISNGDEEAFTTLFDQWKNKLYFFVLKISNSQQIAEDVVQDVFVKLWLNRAKLNGVDNFNAWLFRIAQNHLISGMRRMALETNILAEIQAKNPIQLENADQALLLKQLEEKIQDAVNSLPHRQKQIYTMTRIEGLKQDEIAKELKLSISTIQNHMTEALKNIKKQIEKDYTSSIYIYVLLFTLNSI